MDPGPPLARSAAGQILFWAAFLFWELHTAGRRRPKEAGESNRDQGTGGILTMLGIGLWMGNWVSVRPCLAASLFGYLNRIRVEEPALESALGQPYTDYERRAKRLIPGIW